MCQRQEEANIGSLIIFLVHCACDGNSTVGLISNKKQIYNNAKN